MNPPTTSEKAFEDNIEAVLLRAGFQKHFSKDFDKPRAVFPDEALLFIQQTQQATWAKLEALHGAKTGPRVIEALCKWMDTHGVLTTLRHGFKCFGKTLRIAYFKPAHGLNSELEARYQANRLGITRQLHYSERNQNSLDVTLSLNGVPLMTLELKNALSGSTAGDAIAQYRKDRDQREPIFEFKKRTLVHFAVDTDTAHMTTRLAGSATHFLPFNVGCEGGAGNPPDPKGQNYRTAYLWEEVLQPDSFMDLLARFLHLQTEEKMTDDGKRVRKESMIFPRYHQLRAVRRLEAAAASEGPGHNFLIEHSAGSGKSNTIAWLAHRLSSLHDAKDRRVFDSVIVVTDRIVLDQQLQNTIYQFDHRQGVVVKIDEDSRQLAEALEAEVPIIITTLQKFPFVTDQLVKMAEERGQQGKKALPTRKCAVIIDEAHSSQSGETAAELKGVLGGEELWQKAKALAEEEAQGDMEKVFRTMAMRGQQPNLSFFAFTATPKHKTFKVFGRGDKAFDCYTMRQAIEEGFIMDVLQNYVTYKTFYRLVKKCDDDPNVERKKAAKALSRYMRLHPHNISQKTDIMVEHFQNFSRHKIGGRAKAMVVTGSRLEAVRYKLEFDKVIHQKGYAIRSLVAFSGEVEDEASGKKFTEPSMNAGLREKDLPAEFAQHDYQVLLVAEKYQTGFDQPLLHTMYVDKRLDGIQAVQTLSRLNRSHPLKEDTFVLDFVNEPGEIQAAFKQYFDGAVVGEEVDPDRLYEIKAELDASGIYFQTEVTDYCRLFFAQKSRQSPNDHKHMDATLNLAVGRFLQMQTTSEEECELWRGKLQAFRNLYTFLSQVIPYQDSDLEKLYAYLKALVLKLPKRKAAPDYQFDDEIRLEYYRLQKMSEGSVSLAEGKAKPLDGPREVGSGMLREDRVPLSRLIDLINERFGDDLNEADQLFFDQLALAGMQAENLRQAREGNPVEKFRLVSDEALEGLFIERMDLNEDLFARYMNNEEFRQMVREWFAAQLIGGQAKPIPYKEVLKPSKGKK